MHAEKPHRYQYCLERVLSLLICLNNVKVGVHKNPIDSVLLEEFARALKVCRHNETRYAQKPSSFQYCWVRTMLRLSECADRLKLGVYRKPTDCSTVQTREC